MHFFKHQKATEEEKPPERNKADFARAVRLEETDAEAALAQVRSAFALEGFGALAEIDLRGTLEAKLDKAMAPLWLLDFCNPSLADRALAISRKAALLMPCKVAIWQEGRDAVVAALRPVIASAVTGLDELQPIGLEAERHLERALIRLATGASEIGATDELASSDDA
jgi:uncharacterized protein (DUF302 family)